MTDRDRRLRFVVAWGFYALAVVLAIGYCLWVKIDPVLGIVLFLLGYVAGRITKSAER